MSTGAGAGAETVAVATAQSRHQMHMMQVAARQAQHQAQVAARHHIAAAAVVPVNVSSQTQAAATGPVSKISPAVTLPVKTGSLTPAAPSNSGTGTSTPSNTSTSGSPGSGTSTSSPLPAKVSQPLQTLYNDFKNGGDIFKTGDANMLKVEGNNVGVQVHSNGGDFNAFVAALKSAGMQIQTASSAFDTVEGMLPIDSLPNIAQLSQTLSVTPLFKPQVR